MFRISSQPKILLKNSIAALLMLTLSGAFYLFCCQPAAAKSAHHQAIAESSAEDCHFSKNKSSETSPAATLLNSFECCPLKFNFFVAKLEKNEFPQQAPALANKFSGFFKSVKLAHSTGFTDFSYRAPAFESRDSHIRNCIFRI